MAATKDKELSLPEAALADMRRSGLDGKDMRRLRIQPLSRGQVKALGLPAFRAIRIPYFDWRGKPTAFYRLRYLEDTRTGFDRNTDRKPMRYVQTPDSINEVYAPPIIQWEKVIGDPEVPLVITEGEKKSACGCKNGMPTLGLGGVWCFKSNAKKVALLPQLKVIKWAGRKVYLIYDSDARTNPDVVAAQVALCKELTSLGALPHVVQLPDVVPAEKTGLDDFIVTKGMTGLGKLLEEADAFEPMQALYELNSEVAYVKSPGLVVVLSDGRKLAPSAFKEHAYANRYYHEEKTTKDGVKLEKKPVAPAWLGWERRVELERITYKPGEPNITTSNEFNCWRGWGVEPKKGDVQPWKDLLNFLFPHDKEAMRWFEKWCAYPIQNPGYKMFSCAVLWGVKHGTGKTMVGHMLMRVYGANSTEIKDRNLEENHNEWAENKQFVMGDDVMSGEHRKTSADRLKAMITQKELRLNPKYVPSYTVPDCINYYFTSNHPDAFFLEDTDRRYFIHEVAGLPREREFYKRCERWYLSDEGAAALFHYLLHLDVSGFDPRGPAMETVAKAAMTETSLSDLGMWVRKLKTTPDAVLRLGPNLPLTGDLWTNSELLKLYDPDGKTKVSANGLGREMKRAGFVQAAHGMPIRLPTGEQSRLYAARNPDEWKDATQVKCAKHYADTRGDPKEKESKRDGKKKF